MGRTYGTRFFSIIIGLGIGIPGYKMKRAYGTPLVRNRTPNISTFSLQHIEIQIQFLDIFKNAGIMVKNSW
jgi:hypothetical protein